MSDITKEQLDALKVRIYDAAEANEKLVEVNQLQVKALTDVVKALGITTEQVTYDTIVAGVIDLVSANKDLQAKVDASTAASAVQVVDNSASTDASSTADAASADATPVVAQA